MMKIDCSRFFFIFVLLSFFFSATIGLATSAATPLLLGEMVVVVVDSNTLPSQRSDCKQSTTILSFLEPLGRPVTIVADAARALPRLLRIVAILLAIAPPVGKEDLHVGHGHPEAVQYHLVAAQRVAAAALGRQPGVHALQPVVELCVGRAGRDHQLARHVVPQHLDQQGREHAPAVLAGDAREDQGAGDGKQVGRFQLLRADAQNQVWAGRVALHREHRKGPADAKSGSRGACVLFAGIQVKSFKKGIVCGKERKSKFKNKTK